MLEIINLHAEVEGQKILQGLDLKIDKGEVHSITVSYTHLTLPTKA